MGAGPARVLDRELLVQHRDPLAFFDTVGRNGAWAILWPKRMAVWLLFALALLTLLFRVEPETRLQVVLGPLLVTLLLIFVMASVTIPTGTYAPPGQWLFFWFLYLSSAPILFVLLLCAVAPLGTIALVLGYLFGVPIVLFFFVTDALALVVRLAARKEERQRVRYHEGGPAAALPALHWWRWVRWLRIGLATLLFSAAIWLLITDGQMSLPLTLFLCIAACASLRLEATLLALMNFPLARFEEQTRSWQATYIGRNLLFLPPEPLVRALRQHPTPAEQSLFVLCLLAEGGAGPGIRRAIAQLSAADAHALMVHLSVSVGGAEALRFLIPGLSPDLQPIASTYAALAAEAAKPLRLQHWLRLLPGNQDPDEEAAVESILDAPGHAALSKLEAAAIAQLLARARASLECYSYAPSVDAASALLRHFVTTLGQSPAPAHSGEAQPARSPSGARYIWPDALLIHLDHHQRLLYSSAHD